MGVSGYVVAVAVSRRVRLAVLRAGGRGAGTFWTGSAAARGRQVWRSVAVGSLMDRLGRGRPARVAAGSLEPNGPSSIPFAKRAQPKIKPSHLSSPPQQRPPSPAPPPAPMAEPEHPPQVSSEPTTPPQEGSGRTKKKNNKNRSKKQPKRAAADTDGVSSGASKMVEDPFLVLAGGKEGGN